MKNYVLETRRFQVISFIISTNYLLTGCAALFISTNPESKEKGTTEKINARGKFVFSYGSVVPKIKSSFSYDDSVKSVKYITPLRALREFILTPE